MGKMPEEGDRSGYLIEAQQAIEAQQKIMAVGTARVRKLALVGGVAIGATGLSGGVLEAVDSMENQKIAWVVGLAVYIALILAAGFSLLWSAIRGAEDSNIQNVLERTATSLLKRAGESSSPDGAGASRNPDANTPDGELK